MAKISEGELYIAIGQRIRARRSVLELTQQELGDRVGLTRTSVTNVEQGRQKIQIHTLYSFAAEMGIEATDLLPPTTMDREVVQEDLLSARAPDEVEFFQRVMSRRRGPDNAATTD